MEHSYPILVGARLLGAALVLVLIGLALRAWRRAGEPRMLRFAIGFSFILLSLGIEALSFNFLFEGDLVLAHAIEAVTSLVGFGILVWALY